MENFPGSHQKLCVQVTRTEFTRKSFGGPHSTLIKLLELEFFFFLVHTIYNLLEYLFIMYE